MISVEKLLQKLAAQNGAVFTVGETVFQPSDVLGTEGFSFMPLVALQAVRLARELSAGIESEFDMDLVGAQCHPGVEPFGIGVSVRPLGEEVGVLRGLLFQQAADRLFGWNEQKSVDLQAVLSTYLADGYAQEHVALENYAATLAARLLEANKPAAALAE